VEIFWEKVILKKTVLSLVLALVALVGFNMSYVYADQPALIAFDVTLGDDYTIESQDVNGSELLLRGLNVPTAAVTGALDGNATYTGSYNVNLVTNKAVLWGKVKIDTVSGICVGAFEGNFEGTSVFHPNSGSFYPDKGGVTLHGSGGCSGLMIKGYFAETDGVDGVFHFTGGLN
jgi:hypothetical protein